MKTAAEKLAKLLKAFAICALLVGLFIVLTENRYASTANQHASAAEDSPAVAENQNASAAENQPTAIECGSCGAHVYEYWYWENMNDGTPVKICRYCYENCIENTEAENTATEN